MRQTPSTRPPLVLLALAAAAASAGCSTSGTVSGTVRFDGAPLPMGRVTFVGPDGRTTLAAIEDGRYEVADAPLGPCKVKVETHFPSPPAGKSGAGRTEEQRRMLEQEQERLNPEMARRRRDVLARYVEIPERYADPEQSGLACTVGRGGQTFDIDLEKPAGWKPAGKQSPPGTTTGTR
jgi:hypothetical protein